MRLSLALLLLLFIAACNEDKLPIYGTKTITIKIVDGKQVQDSIDYAIPPFSFVDQNGQTITEATIANKIYVADFFFTSCPSICPKMMAEMLKVKEKYPDVIILSHSIDPERDSVPRLKAYEKKLGTENSNWHFLTGIQRDSIVQFAEKYLVYAAQDSNSPGGYVHDGNFILVDKQRRLRGYYDGTTDAGTEKLLKDIGILMKEK